MSKSNRTEAVIAAAVRPRRREAGGGRKLDLAGFSKKRPLAASERPKSREETPNVGSDAACETTSLSQHVGIRTVSQSAKTPNLVDDAPGDALMTQP